MLTNDAYLEKHRIRIRMTHLMVIAKVGKLIYITYETRNWIHKIGAKLSHITLVVCYSLVKCCSNPFLNVNDVWYLFCGG